MLFLCQVITSPDVSMRKILMKNVFQCDPALDDESSSYFILHSAGVYPLDFRFRGNDKQGRWNDIYTKYPIIIIPAII